MKMLLLVKALLLTALMVPAVCSAQQYPVKLVTMVIPFPPGGSNDLIGRHLANSLGRLWKQTIVVENRPGGGSAIGSAYVAKSAPDGYKLLLVSASYTTNAATRKDQPFDPVKDLVPVSMVARGKNLVISGMRVPMATLADLAREVKTKPIYYGTAGVGSAQHFNAELLNDAMGIQMTPVPYKGGQEAIQDLIGGRIDVIVGSLGGLLPTVNAGKAKAIAVLSKTRSPAMPNVPTAAEAGYPNAVIDNYWAIFVPAGTPGAVASKISEGIKTVTHTQEGRQFLAKMDGEPTELSAQEVTAYVKKEIEHWTKLAKRMNISTK